MQQRFLQVQTAPRTPETPPGRQQGQHRKGVKRSTLHKLLLLLLLLPPLPLLQQLLLLMLLLLLPPLSTDEYFAAATIHQAALVTNVGLGLGEPARPTSDRRLRALLSRLLLPLLFIPASVAQTMKSYTASVADAAQTMKSNTATAAADVVKVLL